MAAWGGGPFENDRAFYWAVSLKDSSDLALPRDNNEGFGGVLRRNERRV